MFSLDRKAEEPKPEPTPAPEPVVEKKSPVRMGARREEPTMPLMRSLKRHFALGTKSCYNDYG